MKNRKSSNTPIEDFENRLKEFEKRNSNHTLKPTKRKNKRVPYPLIFPILIPIIFPFTFIGIMVTLFVPDPPPVRHIEVHGVQCHLEYVVDRLNSHGGPAEGHDKIVCP